LSVRSEALSRFEKFRREDYVSVKEVEIPHLERHLDVVPGETLVPIPPLEKNLERRTFLTRFTNVIGLLIAVPLFYPAFRLILHPMYKPYDNTWLSVGSVAQFPQVDLPRLIKFEKNIQEGYLDRSFEKSHWAIRASLELRSKIYQDREVEFRDENGALIWVNQPDTEIVVFSGKCPHLGCAYRWRKHKRFGQVFLCPCHFSVFDPSGEVLDGPSPRTLDILPTRVTGDGRIEIIDLEYKAGKEERVRLI
jgi:Rieske Fe-S protein